MISKIIPPKRMISPSSMEEITDKVCEILEYNVDRLFENNRKYRNVVMRQLITTIAWMKLNKPLREIGGHFWKRTSPHSAVIYSRKQVRDRYMYDIDFEMMIDPVLKFYDITPKDIKSIR